LYGPGAIYSNALFETCVEEKSNFKKISNDLKDWQARLEKEPELALFASDATMSDELRETTLAEICKDTGYAELTEGMIMSLIQNQATSHLADVIKGFDELYSYNYNSVQATVTSAEPLTPAQFKSVESKLRGLQEKGSDLSIEQKVDPSLIGGLTIEMGTQFQDLSVRTAINACERAMRASA
jgi:F-type H+-transporting ATPase subunit O